MPSIIVKIVSPALSVLCFLYSLIAIGIYMIPRGYADEPFPAVERPAQESVSATREEAAAKGGGWYVTMDEEFGGDALPAPWVTSPHGLRNTEYWCDNLVDASQDGLIRVLAAQLEDNDCAVCPAAGDFAGGIETRRMVDGKSVPTFAQAFGYYEARVRVPDAPGLWSAFWLQADSQGQVGSYGRDGAEIDIFESAFRENPVMNGNA
ncbi:MAG: family 16 glycosylhydrolase, partial [Oscillospiraceae bacterium]|nr:family 16 glycosylhydrolase [Oscillospiraceae bacterium]